jgi:hypothetical protein
MGHDVSKRAQILWRVVKHLYDDDYEDSGDRIVFGTESEFIKEGMDPADSAYMETVRDELYRFFGQKHSQERVSVTPTANTEHLFRRLDAIPRPDGSKFAASYLQTWKEVLGRPSTERSPGVLSDPQVKVLEQRYLAEMLGKLERVIGRACRLQKLDLDRIPRRDVRTYFEEAHRCYLYGFHVACAVMCRAILESALKETVDPRESPTVNKLNRAGLPAPLPDWAKEVKKAGDWAIHNLKAFESNYPPQQLEGILCKARKVVESLYEAPHTTVPPDAKS